MAQENLGFVFPGQGSQQIGMLADIAEQNPLIIDTFAEATAVLGYDLWDLVQHGEQDDINQTQVTQPLLLTASVALWRLWADHDGALPSVMAGHSLGEWSALVCADVIDFADAVKMVRNRGEYMQSAVPAGEGAMAAIIGLDDDAIRAACDSAAQGEVVAPVNFNSSGQVVIAGGAEAVTRAIGACQEAGARRAMLLPVSAPFHTSLMQPAADLLSKDLSSVSFRSPSIPIIHNVTVATEEDPDKIRELMIQQITAPVPWVATVQKLKEMGVESLVECGPGKVLVGLIKRIEREFANMTIDTADTFSAAVSN